MKKLIFRRIGGKVVPVVANVANVAKDVGKKISKVATRMKTREFEIAQKVKVKLSQVNEKNFSKLADEIHEANKRYARNHGRGEKLLKSLKNKKK